MGEPLTQDERALRLLIVRLGAAMNAAGEPVYVIQRRLSLIAAAYGFPAVRISAFPTYLIVSLDRGEPATLELTTVAVTPRLDQIAEVERLVALAERAEVSTTDALRMLDEIHAVDARFGLVRSVVGYSVLALGLCLVLDPGPREVLLAAVLGGVVGLLRAAGRKHHDLEVLMPFVAAFTVAVLCGLAIRSGASEAALRPVAASLVVFLPGAAMTTGVLELAAGQTVSGSTRVVAGAMHLALLAFGIVAGVGAAGIPSTALAADAGERLGTWAPGLGVLVFAIGVTLSNAVPKRSLPSLVLVLYAAWGGQLAGNALLGGYVSAFLGATAMTIVAEWTSRLRSALPPNASFLPGFWLLVPGALGLMGLTQLAGESRAAGTEQLVATIVSMYGVALGVLTGTLLLSGTQATGRFLSRRVTAARAPRPARDRNRRCC